MHKNRVELNGEVSWNPPPHFDIVARENKQPVSFLRFNVVVKRDEMQKPSKFPSDSIRIVAYGNLAERTFAALEPDADVEVYGWLQSRRIKHGTVLEVVAKEISTTGQVLPQRLLKRLQGLAAQQELPVQELVSLLLESQIAATESGLGSNGGRASSSADVPRPHCPSPGSDSVSDR